MKADRKQQGFSLIELMLVVAIALIILGIAIPSFLQAIRNYRIAGDTQNLNGEILVAKMRAAANFTRYRVVFNLTTGAFLTEHWDKETSTWIPEAVGAPQNLSQGVEFGVGDQTDPPADTQTALDQAPVCVEGDVDEPGGGAEIADTAAIFFNSRGFPVNDAGTATTDDAIYVTNGGAVHGVTVSITGLTRIWRHAKATTDPESWFRD